MYIVVGNYGFSIMNVTFMDLVFMLLYIYGIVMILIFSESTGSVLLRNINDILIWAWSGDEYVYINGQQIQA